MTSLALQHDCLLLDLDGTLYRGHSATVGAVETLASVQARALFVTNNASRSAPEVARHLRELGFTADASQVVTSAQSAARLLTEHLAPGASVLVVGTEALAAEVAAVGLTPVRTFDEGPVAVVQGLSTSLGWSDLAEAALAIRAGALWVTANLDATLPTERGLLPGNGSMVAALRAATGAEPLVAGKPAPALMRDALARGHFRAPLAVGDRLDTDIAGANAAGLPSLMVLTGVSTAAEAVWSAPALRPTYIGADLRALFEPPAVLAIGADQAWRIDAADHVVTIHAAAAGPGGDDLSVVRAAARAVWDRWDDGRPPALRAGDDAARSALEHWSLLDGPIG